MLCCVCLKPTFPDGSPNKRAGRWHNLFKREYLNPKQFENRLVDGLWKIVNIETGEEDWSEHLSSHPF